MGVIQVLAMISAYRLSVYIKSGDAKFDIKIKGNKIKFWINKAHSSFQNHLNQISIDDDFMRKLLANYSNAASLLPTYNVERQHQICQL